MTDTQTIPDAETLSKLDFAPECGCHQRIWFSYDKCVQKAVWSATLGCCGHTVLFCQGHAVSDLTAQGFECFGCGVTHFDSGSWRWVSL